MIGGVSSSSGSSDIFMSLAQAEMAPYTQRLADMQTKESNNSLQIAAMQNINTQLSALQTALTSLQGSDIYNATTSSSSNTGVATITSQAGAISTSYNLTKVTQLATSTKILTNSNNPGGGLGGAVDPTATLLNAGFGLTPTNGGTGNGSFTIDGVSIQYNVNTDKLNDNSDPNHSIANKINNAMITAGKNITASYDSATDKFTLTRTDSTDPISIGSGADQGNLLSVLNLTNAGQDTSKGYNTVTSSIHLKTARSDQILTSKDANFGVGVTSGSFTINGTTLNIDKTDTLKSVIGKINSSGAGVTASYDTTTDKLSLTSKSAGATSIGAGSATDTSNFLSAAFVTNSLGTQQLGNNAIFQIDGINGGNPITRSSNSISDLIQGVTINLQNTYNTGSTPQAPVTLSISQDTTKVYNAISSFVSAFNNAASNLKIQTAPEEIKNDKVSAPAGQLYGDAFFTGMRGDLQVQATSIINGITGQYNSLSSIGVSLNDSGELQIDSSVLNSALSSNMSDVKNIFTQSNSGLATVLKPYLDGVTNSTTGALTQSINYLTQTNSDLDAKIQSYQDTMTSQQDYYTQKYAALEKIYNQMLSQSSSLTSLLGSITTTTSSSLF